MKMFHLLCMIMIVVVFVGCSVKQNIFIESASLKELSMKKSSCEERGSCEVADLLLKGHHAVPGNNLLLLIRHFEPGDLLSIDDELFEKFSFEVCSYELGVPVNIGSPDVIIRYSAGGSSFIRKGWGVYSESGVGTITILCMEKDKIVANIEFSTTAESVGLFSFEENVKIQGSYTFNRMEMSNLTPWIGAPGNSIAEEVYP